MKLLFLPDPLESQHGRLHRHPDPERFPNRHPVLHRNCPDVLQPAGDGERFGQLGHRDRGVVQVLHSDRLLGAPVLPANERRGGVGAVAPGAEKVHVVGEGEVVDQAWVHGAVWPDVAAAVVERRRFDEVEVLYRRSLVVASPRCVMKKN